MSEREGEICALLDRACQGDSDAEASLKVWIWEFANRVLVPRVYDQNDRERILSEIYDHLTQKTLWEKLVERCKQGGEDYMLCYLARTVINAYLDVMRRDQRRRAREIPVSPDDYLLENEATTEDDPSRSAEMVEMFDILGDCIANLEELDREIVELHYGLFDPELTLGEIATKHGLAEEAVKKRMQRARTKLKDCFESYSKVPV